MVHRLPPETTRCSRATPLAQEEHHRRLTINRHRQVPVEVAAQRILRRASVGEGRQTRGTQNLAVRQTAGHDRGRHAARTARTWPVCEIHHVSSSADGEVDDNPRRPQKPTRSSDRVRSRRETKREEVVRRRALLTARSPRRGAATPRGDPRRPRAVFSAGQNIRRHGGAGHLGEASEVCSRLCTDDDGTRLQHIPQVVVARVHAWRRAAVSVVATFVSRVDAESASFAIPPRRQRAGCSATRRWSRWARKSRAQRGWRWPSRPTIDRGHRGRIVGD